LSSLGAAPTLKFRRNDAEPLRVAIIGMGPKGLFALERLLHQAALGPEARVEVEIFEPHRAPGAGPVYDPAQPPYLRMNFSSEQVDVWPTGSQAVPFDRQLSFPQWRRLEQPGSGDEAYAPRSQVGRYLSAVFASLLADPPQGVSISLRAVAVESVRAGDRGWRLSTELGASDFDELLIATGHARDWDGALSRSWNHAAPLVEAVFPVDEHLGPERVAPGAQLGTRGFALTFIDAVLALTEGRGGSFEPAGGGSLRYLPSGTEPAKIYPFSRTGKRMLAKPGPDAVGGSESWERQASEAREQILGLAPGFGVDANLAPIVADVAAAHGSVGDPSAALGAAWRAAYPAVVERLGGNGLEDREWPAFRALAARMERIAFGPPAINASKLSALVEAGIVDVRHAAGGELATVAGCTELRSSAGRTDLDVVLDAVLPPPGVVGLESPLLTGLMKDGYVRVRSGRRGIDVTEDGTCVSATGIELPGLAACGRPTEDSVIGNDTLDRSLHPQVGRWAERVIAGVRAHPGVAAVPQLR
jgi:uncharacterized NAD(P)/FAD-binding protein YdhS